MTDSPPSSADPVRLHVVVQHHPARAHLLPALTEALGDCQLVTDPEPDGNRSPIRTYLACLRALPPWASHLAICQDDIRPVANFSLEAKSALIERPDSAVALFLGGAPARSARLAQQAHRRGERWIRLHASDWCPTVCTVWTRELAVRFLAFCDANPTLIRMGDDNVAGAFVKAEHVPVWVRVPSLVEHPDVEPSLIRRKASAGRNRYRVAAVPPIE